MYQNQNNVGYMEETLNHIINGHQKHTGASYKVVEDILEARIQSNDAILNILSMLCHIHLLFPPIEMLFPQLDK